MTVYCSVDSCYTRAQIDGLSFFRCPKDEQRCKIWKKALRFTGNHRYANITPDQCHKRIRICSLHFQTDNFTCKFKKQLTLWAVPSLHLDSKAGAAQETKQSGNGLGDGVLTDIIKEEVDDDVFAESQDDLLLTKEEILTLAADTSSEMIVKEEPDSEDENEPATKRSRVEYDQVSNDLDQPGSSRVATTDEPQTCPEKSTGSTHTEQMDLALDNLLTYTGDLDMFFKTILSEAKKLDPVDQIILQRNITNAVFDIKIKEMTKKKS